MPTTLALASRNAHKVVNSFRDARAVSGGSARHLADLRLNHSAALRELIATRVIRKAGADRYFLDEDVWALRRRLKGSTVLRVGLPALLALAAALLLWSSR